MVRHLSLKRATILVLVDEIGKAGPTARTRSLIKAIERQADVVVVGRCYLSPLPRHFLRQELYGFDARDFDAKVATFASQITKKHTPGFIISCGWENPSLVVALDRLDLPVVCYIDESPPAETAEDQLHEIIRHAAYIVVRGETVLSTLARSRPTLDAREDKTMVLDDLSAKYSCSPPAAKTGFLRRLGFGAGKSAEELRSSEASSATADRLIALGQRAMDASMHVAPLLRHDRETIEAAGLFNKDLYRSDRPADEAGRILDYLRASRRAAPRDRALSGTLLRRPAKGFNPLIYASDNTAFDEARGEDPLAHFIRSNRPNGRWCHDVIEPKPGTRPSASSTVLIHAHVHYPDLLRDLVRRIMANETRPNLLITTSASNGRDGIDRVLDRTGLDAEVTLVENLGRDLWPFLDLLMRGRFDEYDVIGHVHAKRSPSYVSGDQWRDFLWDHLIGGDAKMMDTILERFSLDHALGLVFPEDPHLEGWQANRKMAQDLAKRAGIPASLPHHFEYPIGSMFWARTRALRPLRALGLTREMMPTEPVPNDGTILHALERLVPFLVAKAGFRAATAHVPGSIR